MKDQGFRTPRWYGYIYHFLSVLMICLQHLQGKLLFTRSPNLNLTQLLFMRSIVNACINLGQMNSQIKYCMYTSIERNLLPQLALRVTFGLAMIVCVYTSVKFLPLVYVSLSSNLGPLLVALFAYFYYGIPVSKIDVIILIVCFIGVAILITGTVQDPSFVDSSSFETAAISSVEGFAIEKNVSNTFLIIPIIAMLGIPIIGAA